MITFRAHYDGKVIVPDEPNRIAAQSTAGCSLFASKRSNGNQGGARVVCFTTIVFITVRPRAARSRRGEVAMLVHREPAPSAAALNS